MHTIQTKKEIIIGSSASGSGTEVNCDDANSDCDSDSAFGYDEDDL